MDYTVVEQIKQKLGDVELNQRVTIPLAVESGSRAWGFPSPDSDYDCRFIYVPRLDATLGLFSPRDVIELPLTDIFDINGWELRKAVKLMLKGNAVVIEWLRSPIAYCRNDRFCRIMNELVGDTFQRPALVNHYLHLLNKIAAAHFQNPEQVSLKKVFYALRAAMALRYLRVNSGRSEIPMTLSELCAGASLNGGFQHLIDEMILAKARTNELGAGPLVSEFRSFFEIEIEEGAKLAAERTPLTETAQRRAEAVYLDLLKEFAPQ